MRNGMRGKIWLAAIVLFCAVLCLGGFVCAEDAATETEEKAPMLVERPSVRTVTEDGIKINESYWLNGEPVLCKDGYHEIRYEYNENKKVIRTTYYGLKGEKVNSLAGYCEVCTEISEAGSTISIRRYNTEGTLVPENGREYAYSRFIPVAELSLAGTEALRGRAEELAEQAGTLTEYYGTDDQLMVIEKGYACFLQLKNEHGVITEEAYYGRQGENVLNTSGYHRMVRKNDGEGNALQVSYFGTAGEAVVSSNGYHRVENTWLDKNHKLSEAWFDAEGKPVPFRNTYVKVTWEYDAEGHRIAEKYFGEDGNPAPCKDGYMEIRWVY